MKSRRVHKYKTKRAFLICVVWYVLWLLTTHKELVQQPGLKLPSRNLDEQSQQTTHLKETGWLRLVKDKDVLCSAFQLPMTPEEDRMLIHKPLNCTKVLAKKLPAWVSIHNGVALVDINLRDNKTSVLCMFWG
jgi:hypothetical protein